MPETVEKKSEKTSPHLLTIKNIVIGVVTTVLGATSIYFLGLQQGPSEAKKRKDATVKVWKEYLAVRKTTNDVFESMNREKSADLNMVRSNLNHEIEIINQNMEKLSKIPDIDINLVRIIDVRIAQMNDYKKAYSVFVDEMINFANQNPTEEEGRAFLNERSPSFIKEAKNILKRDSLRLNTYYTVLEKEYKIDMSEKKSQ